MFLSEATNPNSLDSFHSKSKVKTAKQTGEHAGKFLQLSQLLEGRKTFVIFPCDCNDSGWTKIVEAIKGIVGPVVGSVGQNFLAPSATLVAFNSAWLLSSVWLY